MTAGRKDGGWGMGKSKLGARLTNNWLGKGGGYWDRYSVEWVEVWLGDRRGGRGAGGS